MKRKEFIAKMDRVEHYTLTPIEGERPRLSFWSCFGVEYTFDDYCLTKDEYVHLMLDGNSGRVFESSQDRGDSHHKRPRVAIMRALSLGLFREYMLDTKGYLEL